MAKRRSSIKGNFKLRGVLRRIAAMEQSDLPKAMAQAADLVLATQQKLIPRDTGAAGGALEVKISKSGLDARIGLIGKRKNEQFFYMRFVEYGTKGYSGVLYHRADADAVGGLHTTNRDRSGMRGKRNALRARDTKNKSDGSHFFGYYPDIPARPAHPWLRPSIDMNRDDIRIIIREAIASTLVRAAKEAGTNG
jgi:HK97 gp10 family phage protein